MSNRLLKEALNEPDAYFFVQALNAALEIERNKRINFYNDITEQEKVEFINGEIVVHSPVRKQHNVASLLLARLMSIYSDIHKLGFVGIEKIMITLTRNDYEPDICFFKNDIAVNFQDKQTLFPAPNLVVEILSEGTKERDRGIKFKDYQSHQIEEYWIIDPEQETFEQYHLENGVYELIIKAKDGIIESYVMAGFRFPIKAIFDETANLEALKTLV